MPYVPTRRALLGGAGIATLLLLTGCPDASDDDDDDDFDYDGKKKSKRKSKSRKR